MKRRQAVERQAKQLAIRSLASIIQHGDVTITLLYTGRTGFARKEEDTVH